MTSSGNDSITLRWYLAVLRERWKLVALGSVVGLVLASLYLVATEQSVTARTVVSITVIGTSPLGSDGAASKLIDTSTETEVATSFEVASRASQLLGGAPTARQIRDGVAVSSVADATVLEVRYTAPTADQARATADAVAQGYLDYRTDVAKRRIDAAVSDIDVRTAELRGDLKDLTTQLARQRPDSENALSVETDRSVVLDSLRTLLSQRFELDRVDTSAGVVISPAAENYVVMAPSKRLVLAGGLFAGLLLGCVAAFVVNATSRRVRTERQLASILGGRSLGKVTIGRTASSPDLLHRPEVRTVGAHLAAEVSEAVDTLVVVDMATGDVPTALPFVLGASLAQTGRPVGVVVAGTTSTGRVALADSLELTPLGAANHRRPAHRTPLSDRVRVYFAPVNGDVSDFEQTLDRAGRSRSRSADGPSPLVMIVVSEQANPDALIMSLMKADAVLVVARLGLTSRSSLLEVADEADRVGCRTIGAVLIETPDDDRRSRWRLPVRRASSERRKALDVRSSSYEADDDDEIDDFDEVDEVDEVDDSSEGVEADGPIDSIDSDRTTEDIESSARSGALDPLLDEVRPAEVQRSNTPAPRKSGRAKRTSERSEIASM